LQNKLPTSPVYARVVFLKIEWHVKVAGSTLKVRHLTYFEWPFVSASTVLAALRWPTPQAVGWRHGSVHDAQHIGAVDKPRERWAGARRQGRGSRGTWLRWRELCVLESNAGDCELQISGGMRVIIRHSSPEIGRDAMALVSGKQGSWRPSRCQRGADTCRWAARSRRQMGAPI
jgi:hypothetical protein